MHVCTKREKKITFNRFTEQNTCFYDCFENYSDVNGFGGAVSVECLVWEKKWSKSDEHDHPIQSICEWTHNNRPHPKYICFRSYIVCDALIVNRDREGNRWCATWHIFMYTIYSWWFICRIRLVFIVMIYWVMNNTEIMIWCLFFYANARPDFNRVAWLTWTLVYASTTSFEFCRWFCEQAKCYLVDC